MQTPTPPEKQPDPMTETAKPPPHPEKPDAPAGNESNNPLGDPNDVGTAGDYSR